MRNYEFTVIFDPSEDVAVQGLERVNAQFAEHQVEVTKHEDMGVRNLAYQIKKQDKGHYHYMELSADPAVIVTLEHAFRLMQPVLKFLFVVKDK